MIFEYFSLCFVEGFAVREKWNKKNFHRHELSAREKKKIIKPQNAPVITIPSSVYLAAIKAAIFLQFEV